MNLTPQQLKKLERVAQVADIVDGGLEGLTKHVFETEDRVDTELVTIKDSIPDYTKVLETLRTEIPEVKDGEQGQKGDKGDKGDTGLQGKSGLNGQDGKDGRDGKDGLNGLDGLNGQNAEIDLEELAINTVNYLETLQGEERLDRKAIKGIDDLPTLQQFEDLKRITIQKEVAVPVTTSFFQGLRAKNLNIVGATATQSGDTVNLTIPTYISSQWTTSGTAIYYNTGNVSIGTTDVTQARLTVSGAGTTTGKAFLVEDSSGADKFYVQDNGSAVLNGAVFDINQGSGITLNLTTSGGTSSIVATSLGGVTVTSFNNMSYVSGNDLMFSTVSGNINMTSVADLNLNIDGLASSAIYFSQSGSSLQSIVATDDGRLTITSADLLGFSSGSDISFNAVGDINFYPASGTVTFSGADDIFFDIGGGGDPTKGGKLYIRGGTLQRVQTVITGTNAVSYINGGGNFALGKDTANVMLDVVGWVNYSGQKRVNANVTNATVTMANITGLSATLVAGRKYTGRIVLFAGDSVAADGIKVDFDGGTATMTSFSAQTKIYDTALLTSSNTTAIATDIMAATMTGVGAVEVVFAFVANVAGTFIPRFAQNTHTTGTATVYLNSYMILEDVT